MTTFKHFLLTRFNGRFTDWQVDKRSKCVGDNEWLKHRFHLFDKICFPSIKNQSTANFTWFLIFDQATPGDCRESIDKYRREMPNMEIIFTTEAKMVEDVKKRIDEYCDYVITTRIDNDDAFHKDALNVIQNNFSRQEFMFLNFCKGYKFLIDEKKLHLSEGKSNPFLTLIEKNGPEIKTAWCAQHHQIGAKWPVRQIEDGRYWLVTIHSKNLLNENQQHGFFSLQRCKQSVKEAMHDPPGYLECRFHNGSILQRFNIDLADLTPSRLG